MKCFVVPWNSKVRHIRLVLFILLHLSVHIRNFQIVHDFHNCFKKFIQEFLTQPIDLLIHLPLAISYQLLYPSERSQAKVIERKIPSERSQAKDPKRKFPSESSQTKDTKRKFPSGISQTKVPKRKIPSESYRAKAPKRKFPSERSQAKDPKRKIPSERW